MDKNTLLRGVTFVILLLAQQVVLADEIKYSLINIWEEGEYSLQQEGFISLISSLGKGEQSFDQTRTNFNWKATVYEFQTDGTQTIDLQATRIQLRLESKDTALLFFDSSNKSLTTTFETEVFQKFMRTIISITIKNGEVIDIKMDDSIWEGLSPTTEAETIFLSALKGLPTLENFKQIFDPFMWAANPNEVSVNDTWKNEISFTLPVVGERSMNWNCRLKSVRKTGGKSVAEVVSNSNFDVKVDESVSANMKAEMNVIFDAKSGSPLELVGKSTVSAIRKSETDSPDLKITAMQKNKLTVVKR